MRRILVDHARVHNAAKRGGLQQKLTLEEARELPAEGDVDLVELDGALESFAKDYPRKSEVVELKFFGGLDAKEISEVLERLRENGLARLELCQALALPRAERTCSLTNS